MRLRAYLGLCAALGGAMGAVVLACYPSAGLGVDPPAKDFYFPVGLAVSRTGTVLYAVNSDFDLQWNGGTIESLDLHLIRRHAVMAIKDPTDPNLPLAIPPPDGGNDCPSGPPVVTTLNDGGIIPGWACAPPTLASFYVRDSAAIGAFATDLQLSVTPNPNVPGHSRLFAPIRGDASLTWADVVDDGPTIAPLPTDTAATYAPFRLDCGARDAHNRCDALHRAGNDPTQPGDTRLITMPGEPFGMAQSEDGTAIIITHQASTDTTLFSSFTPGAPPPPLYTPDAGGNLLPAIQFVIGNVPNGGIGAAAVPHTLDAFPDCIGDAGSQACRAVFPRPAFLQTSRSAAQVSLIRYYDDQGDLPADAGPDAQPPASNPFRPFIQDEVDYPLNVPAGGGSTDYARGIAIDPSPRIRCKAAIAVPPTDPTYNAALEACARIPARVFIASRAPASLVVGELGGPITAGGTYDPDLLVLTRSIPLPAGPSGVHIAPIIDQNGNYSLRVFVVLYDSSEIIAYDPDQELYDVIQVGLGPYALAFDPFDYTAAALAQPVGIDPRDADLQLKKYRFAYVASFTQSYMQVIDLDNTGGNSPTWATVVYTLGVPRNPIGGLAGGM